MLRIKLNTTYTIIKNIFEKVRFLQKIYFVTLYRYPWPLMK